MSRSSTAARYRLSAHALDESTRIEILDGNLRTVPLDHNLGEVSVDVSPGVYVVRFYQGEKFVEKLAALTPSSPTVDVRLEPHEQPGFVAAAPVLGTSTTHEWQREPARELSLSEPRTPPTGHTGGSRLLLFLRNPFVDQTDDLSIGLTLCDLQGTQLFNLSEDGRREPSQRWIGAHLSLDPGVYRVMRPQAEGPVVEQIVFTRPDWQTQVFLLASTQAEEHSAILRSSVLMARPTVGFDFDRPDFRWTESALRALEIRSNIPGAARNEMLWAKFENPMLGIYAALLHLRRATIEPGLIREAFFNLYKLVGPLPDVLAIGWAFALRNTRARSDRELMQILRANKVSTPPMLREAWEHILRASADQTELVTQGSLADRIGGRLVAGGPWVAWISVSPETVEAATPTPSIEVKASDAEASVPASAGIGFLEKIRDVIGKVWKWTQDTLLQSALSALAGKLRGDAEAGEWLKTRRFTDLERAVAYWLRPQINPQLADVLREAPDIEKTLESTDRKRVTDIVSLLIHLNVTSTTALGTALSVYSKLYLKPVLPDESRLDAFVKDESRGHSIFAGPLKRLATRPSRLHRLSNGRQLNLLEFAFLYYRGSPADAQPERGSIVKLFTRLEEAEFVFGEDRQKITSNHISLEHDVLRKEMIKMLERSRQVSQLPHSWKQRVFPSVHYYKRQGLFPLLKKEEPKVAKPKDPAPGGAVKV